MLLFDYGAVGNHINSDLTSVIILMLTSVTQLSLSSYIGMQM
jgi:hypothetical protein